MRFMLVCAMAVSLFARSSAAQINHVAAGDKEYAALNATAALSSYEAAINGDPKNYEALWKASRSAMDLGSYDVTGEQRMKLFSSGELYARRAVAANPSGAEGHFALARALGKAALSVGPRARIRFATDVRSQALECLRIDPRHAGCLHVIGVWNAEVMRLNGFTRMLAKNILGGKVLGLASWKDATGYMEKSVAAEPAVIVHHLDLGFIYRDVGDKAKAREQLQLASTLPISDFNDKHYKAEAEQALKSF